MLNLASHSARWSTAVRFLLALLMALVGSVSSQAIACTVMPAPSQFYTDAAFATSGTAPSVPIVSSARLRRANCEPTSGCVDCSCMGSVTLQVQTEEGQPWPSDVGLRVRVVKGSLPTGIAIPDHALTVGQGTVVFSGGDNAKQPLDFTLSLVAVDLAGQESQPAEVHLTDRGCDDDGGCSIGQQPSSPSHPLTTVILVLGLALAIGIRLRGR